MPDTVPILGERPPITSGDVMEIKFSLFRIEERMTASAEAAEQRHTAMKQAMEAFVPRRELDHIFAGITARLASVDGDLKEKAATIELGDVKRRLGILEANQTWVIRSILGLVLVTLGGAAAFAVKHG